MTTRPRPFARSLGLQSPYIINQGAFIVDPLSETYFVQHFIKPDLVRAVLSWGREWGSVPLLFGRMGGKEFVVIPENPNEGQQIYINACPNDPRFLVATEVDGFADQNIFLIDFHFPSHLSDKAFEDIHKRHFPLNLAMIQETPSITVIEVTHQRANKGDALRWLSAHSGVPLSDFVVFGDNGNDLSLFDAAGRSHAVDNAIEPLKKRAHSLIPSNDEEGVLTCLRNYLSPVL